MSLKAKRILIAVLGLIFLASLLLVMQMEIVRKQEEAGLIGPHIVPPATSETCVECHEKETPGIVEQWKGSTHAAKGIACFDCHKAEEGEIDSYRHEGALIATLVTPLDCGECHQDEFTQFTASHHAKAGNILHSLDNFLAETVEGGRPASAGGVAAAGSAPVSFSPHSPTPGRVVESVDGLAAAATGCQQCHGSKVALQKIGGGTISVDDLKIGDQQGNLTDAEKEALKELTHEPRRTAQDLTAEEADGLADAKRRKALAEVLRNDDGKPLFHRATWPNTGIGRLNLDGSRGSCSACHSRHDFSPRRARQPENCGKCHLGPDHPQKEIYEESKHGIAYRDLKDKMNLDAASWVLGQDYSAAPTCATCHMSAHLRNKSKITHDPGRRISWTNRPMVSRLMDTDRHHAVITETDPDRRAKLLADSWTKKRGRMKDVCAHCHTSDYINAFYQQYDNFVVLYNEKFGKPGKAIMDALKAGGLITATPFDEEIEWTWFYLWHHEGRRARHGASMMAPDYAHWHGTYEVAERFYQELIPQAREIVEHAAAQGKAAEARAVDELIEEILGRSEHAWFETEKQPAEAGPALEPGGPE